MKNSKQLIEELANNLIERLENFNGKWECPFVSALQYNIQSKKAYRGFNMLYLEFVKMSGGYSSNVWGTFKQWTDLGYTIKKGAKAESIIFCKPQIYKEESVNTESGQIEEIEKSSFLLRTYLVFNGSQINNFTLEEEKENFTFAVEYKNFFDNTNIEYILTDEGKAFYRPSMDNIQIPDPKYFKKQEGFISTLSHEMVHATGNKNRLNRDFSGRFGDESYAFEELVAEIGGGFVSAYLGVTSKFTNNNIAYISSWLKVLKEDKRRVLTACSYAQKAFDWLLLQQ